MRRFTSGALLLLTLAACQTEIRVPQVGAPDPDNGSYQVGGSGFVQGELVIGYRDGADVAGIARKLGGTLKTDWPQIKAALIALPEGLTVPKAQVSAQRLRGLRYAEPNYLHRLEDPAPAGGVNTTALSPAQVSVPDPDFGVQWLHRQMKSEGAWAQGVNGEGIRIGIHDEFIDHRHPDLVDNMFYPGFDGFKAATLDADDPIEDAFITPDTPHDGVGFHGTSVAGTAAAASNSIGGLGTAYGASIVPLAATEPENNSFVDSAIVNSAIFSVLGPDLEPGGDDRAPGTDPDTGPYVHIVNMSWGRGSYSQAYKDTMDFMLASGIVLVTSAGNTPTEGSAFPAWNPGLINVAATTPLGGRTSFSNRGLHLDVAAPGENIWTTTTRSCIYATPDGSSCEDENAYTYISGSSFSSPATAGTAALVLEAAAQRDAEGNITGLPSAAQVRHILEETASRPDDYDRSALGAGIVDSEAAVARALETASDPVVDGGSVVVSAVLESNPKIQVPSVGLTLIPDDGEGAVEYTQTSDGALFVHLGLGLFQQMDAGDYTLQASGPYTSVYGTAAATAETELEITPGRVTEVQVELDVDTFDDPFEPNNMVDDAAVLETDALTLHASLYDDAAASDVDVYALPVTGDETYRVNYETVTGSADAALAVYAEDGSVLAENDDNQAFTTDSLVQFEAPEDGVVYLEVSEVSELPAANSPFSLYDLDIAPVIGEEEEPNGSATVIGTTISDLDVADAQEIDLGVALDAALDPEDTDSFRITLAAGETLVADVETAEQYLPDTVLAIYDEAGQQVALNDDSTTVDSRVLYTSETGGAYYVVVVPFDPSNPLYASEGDYGLMVTGHLNPPTE
jgi:serine protease